MQKIIIVCSFVACGFGVDACSKYVKSEDGNTLPVVQAKIIGGEAILSGAAQTYEECQKFV